MCLFQAMFHCDLLLLTVITMGSAWLLLYPLFFLGKTATVPSPTSYHILQRINAAHVFGRVVVVNVNGHLAPATLEEPTEDLAHRRPRRRVLAGAGHPELQHGHHVVEAGRVLDLTVDQVPRARLAALVPLRRPLRQAAAGLRAAVLRPPPGGELQQHDAEAVHVHLLAHLGPAHVLCEPKHTNTYGSRSDESLGAHGSHMENFSRSSCRPARCYTLLFEMISRFHFSW